MGWKTIRVFFFILAANLLLITAAVTVLGQTATPASKPVREIKVVSLAAAESFPHSQPAEVLTYTTILVEERQPAGFGGGEWQGTHDHLSQAQQQAIEAQIEASLQQLEAQGKLPAARPQAVALGWPLEPSDRIADYGYHGVSNFVDHNPGFPNQILDFSCGNRSYDTSGGYNHRGTDFFLWPLAWNRMDAGEVAVVAAASGVIVHKEDGYDDRSCTINNNPWNAVYVRHGDGSVTWYGHLKKGSLTGKVIGESVAQGEYLGLVGSSGSSTGPHLHLELYDPSSKLIDPYQGSCNQLNTTSWWAMQRPYYDSAVNKVTTGHSAPALPNCPGQDASNIQDSFAPGALVYFTTYYRDQLGSQQSHYTIYRPDGTVYQSWTHNMNEAHYNASWWWWSYTMPAGPVGTWRFKVEFNGQSYETTFNVGDPTQITITSPNGGEFLLPGTTHSVTWNDNLGGNVRIDLYQHGQYQSTIATSTASDGTYQWAVPANPSGPFGYQIRIVNLANEAVYSASGAFTIGDPAQFNHLFLPAVMRDP